MYLHDLAVAAEGTAADGVGRLLNPGHLARLALLEAGRLLGLVLQGD